MELVVKQPHSEKGKRKKEGKKRTRAHNSTRYLKGPAGCAAGAAARGVGVAADAVPAVVPDVVLWVVAKLIGPRRRHCRLLGAGGRAGGGVGVGARRTQPAAGDLFEFFKHLADAGVEVQRQLRLEGQLGLHGAKKKKKKKKY